MAPLLSPWILRWRDPRYYSNNFRKNPRVGNLSRPDCRIVPKPTNSGPRVGKSVIVIFPIAGIRAGHILCTTNVCTTFHWGQEHDQRTQWRLSQTRPSRTPSCVVGRTQNHWQIPPHCAGQDELFANHCNWSGLVSTHSFPNGQNDTVCLIKFTTE